MNIAYSGHGAEIEEDLVRLRRRKLEFDADAARRVRRGEPRRRRFGPASAMAAVASRRVTAAPAAAADAVPGAGRGEPIAARVTQC